MTIWSRGLLLGLRGWPRRVLGSRHSTQCSLQDCTVQPRPANILQGLRGGAGGSPRCGFWDTLRAQWIFLVKMLLMLSCVHLSGGEYSTGSEGRAGGSPWMCVCRIWDIMTEDLIHGGGQKRGGNEGSWRQRTYLKRLKKNLEGKTKCRYDEPVNPVIFSEWRTGWERKGEKEKEKKK